MRSDDVILAVHRRVAQILAWSMQCAATGLGPSVGEDTLPFRSAFRHSLPGLPLAGGFRLAYLGFKADMKARKEAHMFERNFNCNFICEACMATKAKPNLPCPFTDFSEHAAHRLSNISHATYVRTAPVLSPWAVMPGFHLHSVFRDLMHILFLGTIRVMIPSIIMFWVRFNALDGGSLAEKLQLLSKDMEQKCKQNGKLLQNVSYSFCGFAFLSHVLPVILEGFASRCVASRLPIWGSPMEWIILN